MNEQLELLLVSIYTRELLLLLFCWMGLLLFCCYFAIWICRYKCITSATTDEL